MRFGFVTFIMYEYICIKVDIESADSNSGNVIYCFAIEVVLPALRDMETCKSISAPSFPFLDFLSLVTCQIHHPSPIPQPKTHLPPQMPMTPCPCPPTPEYRPTLPAPSIIIVLTDQRLFIRIIPREW